MQTQEAIVACFHQRFGMPRYVQANFNLFSYLTSLEDLVPRSSGPCHVGLCDLSLSLRFRERVNIFYVGPNPYKHSSILSYFSSMFGTRGDSAQRGRGNKNYKGLSTYTLLASLITMRFKRPNN